MIKCRTGVEIHRQKLLGVKMNSKPAPDTAQLKDVQLPSSMTVMMMGTREDAIVVDVPEGFDENEVINDFEFNSEVIAVMERLENLEKVASRVAKYKINTLNEPRMGKKLLVLDIDYTIFDHRSSVESIRDLMRPFLHEFLAVAYEYYDIVIWSATSMSWIELKMKELGVLGNPNYKISFLLDNRAMITVDTTTHGVVNTKPLGVIWGKYPLVYNSDTTIMFDDIRRNFLMNPQNGLRIKPFRHAPINQATDTTLKKLAKYLVLIAQLESFGELDHGQWKKYVKERK
eukprot:CFRG3905T1